MITCKKCGLAFFGYANINGKKYNIHSRKYCLDCSPFKQHNTRKIHLLDSNDKPIFPNNEKFCPRCSTIKKISDFYSRRNNTSLLTYCKVCSNKQSTDRQKHLKQIAVDYKGGKCCVCGYRKHIGALDFHHINRSAKDFMLSHYSCTSFNDKIKKELDKCICVCRNCHAEIHAGLITIPISAISPRGVEPLVPT